MGLRRNARVKGVLSATCHLRALFSCSTCGRRKESYARNKEANAVVGVRKEILLSKSHPRMRLEEEILHGELATRILIVHQNYWKG